MADPNVRFLAPQKLEVEPGLQTSQITYKHWKTTFLHFVRRIEANAAAASDAASNTVDKFGLLITLPQQCLST